MTTRFSPLRVLKAQADTLAANLKRAQRGEIAMKHPWRHQTTCKFGVVMDDQTITFDLPWDEVEQASEVALAAMVLRHMRSDLETTH